MVIEDCLGMKRAGNRAKKKPFRRGQRVVGTVTNVALTPDSQVLALKTKEGYIIPEPFLNVLGAVKGQKTSRPQQDDVEYADVEIIEETGSNNKSVGDIYKKFKASDIISRNSSRSKLVVNFALGGAAALLIYAMMKGKNKLVYAGIGAVGGGVVGNYVSKKIKENETQQ
jgi:hypothetical protein